MKWTHNIERQPLYLKLKIYHFPSHTVMWRQIKRQRRGGGLQFQFQNLSRLDLFDKGRGSFQAISRHCFAWYPPGFENAHDTGHVQSRPAQYHQRARYCKKYPEVRLSRHKAPTHAQNTGSHWQGKIKGSQKSKDARGLRFFHRFMALDEREKTKGGRYDVSALSFVEFQSFFDKHPVLRICGKTGGWGGELQLLYVPLRPIMKLRASSFPRMDMRKVFLEPFQAAIWGCIAIVLCPWMRMWSRLLHRQIQRYNGYANISNGVHPGPGDDFFEE